MHTDASDVGLGRWSVFKQEVDGEEHVIAYEPRLLRGAEKSLLSVRKRVFGSSVGR